MTERDPMCAEKCAYGVCGRSSSDDPCGGCCGCLGGCVVAYENTLPVAEPERPEPMDMSGSTRGVER